MQFENLYTFFEGCDNIFNIFLVEIAFCIHYVVIQQLSNIPLNFLTRQKAGVSICNAPAKKQGL